MRPHIRQLPGPLLVLAAVLAGCQSPSEEDTRTTAAETDLDLRDGSDRPGAPTATAYATFDEVWSTVDTRHFDPEHNGVDWDAVRTTYRPMIESTRTNDEVRTVLTRMLAELGQTHFVIIPGDVAADAAEENAEGGDGRSEPAASSNADESDGAEPGTAGLRFEWQGDDAIVAMVEPGSSAERAGIRSGWLVDTVDGEDIESGLVSLRRFARESSSPMAEYEALAGLNARLTRAAGDSIAFGFRDRNDDTVDVEVEFEETEGVPVRFGLLPEMKTRIQSRVLSPEELERWGIGPGPDGWPEIVLVSFNVWMFPIMAPIARIVDEHRDADGFILDLRGNPGGLGALAMGVAGHFMGEPESLGRMEQRNGTMNFTVNPQRATPDGRLVDPFAGPVVIVTDQLSASTSEVFAAGLQQLGRASVVGRPSAGAALPAHWSELPNGDTFLYAIADFIGPAGESIEGSGVVPDRLVAIERERLLTEGDPDIAEAARLVLELDT